MKKYLLDQILKKDLLIKKILYLGYILFILFDNTISYSIYTQNAL